MKIDNKKYIVYFQNGKVSAVVPPISNTADLRDYTYNARFIISDGKEYDLEDRQSVLSIEIPEYIPINTIESPTIYLEYILQRKASVLSYTNRQQAIILLSKSNQLMLYSSFKYNKEDFYRIVNWLEQDLDFELADRWKQWIQDNVPTYEQEEFEHFQETIAECRRLGTDLVEIQWCGGQSAVVAKYQGRVYSISGADKRFPPLPDFVKKQGFVEAPFYGRVDPYFDIVGTIYYKGKQVDAHKISWRAFKDDRSPEEKAAYQKLRLMLLEKEQAKLDLHAFNKLRAALPDLTPKSLSTIYRWRDNPKPQYRAKYDALMEAIQEAGIEFPPKNLELPPEPADPDPSYNGGKKRWFCR